jgi:AraC-like DNA-binding protein
MKAFRETGRLFYFLILNLLYLTMLLKLPDILIILLIFQLLFTSIYLFSKKGGKAISNKLLGCFFLSICISMADNLLLRTGVGYSYPDFVTFSSAFPLLYGPLLFLYTESLIYKAFDISKRAILHFLPFGVLFAISTISYEIQPVSVKLKMLHEMNGHHISRYFYAAALLMIIHFSVYAFSSLSLIKRYREAALNRFSTIREINLNWLSSTIIFFLVLFALSLINNVFEINSLSKLYPVTLLAIILLLFYFVNRFIFKALNNSEYLSWMEEEEAPVKSGINDLPDKTDELNDLTAYMQAHKPYLNPDLTVEMLAKAMRITPKDLSRLINVHLEQNFFDFVNRYRISEAQHLLINSPDKKITVLEVLYQSGFNSKSSFNTLFKKYTGLTPTDFKDQNSRPAGV